MRRFSWMLAFAAILSFSLAGCSLHKSSSHKSAKLDPFAGKGSPYYKGTGPLPKGGGRYLVGESYQVAGRWFTPKEQPGYDKTGMASWYGEAFHRRMTSNGEWFDMNDLTAAHATLPLPSYAKVTNLENGREVVVRINDRGPFVGTRIIDLSKKVSGVLGFRRQGQARVRVQLIGPAPLNDNGVHLAMMNRELQRGLSIRKLVVASRQKVRGTSQVAAVAVEPEPEYQQAAFEPQAEEPPITQEPRNAGYVIQVAAFSQFENAEAARDELADYGPSRILEVSGDDGPYYKLQVGPIDDIEAVQTALSSVHEAGFGDAYVIRARIEQVASN